MSSKDTLSDQRPCNMKMRPVSLFIVLTVLLLIPADAFTSPQQITWFYVNDLPTGAGFFGDTLELLEVPGLIQKDKCRIFHSTEAPSTYLGVCNTRAAPQCSPGSSGDAVASTYTFVAASRSAVDTAHKKLAPLNNTRLIVTQPSGSPIWGAYAFNFYDTNTATGLGCYRFEIQAFTDPAWRPDTYDAMQAQLRAAGSELYGTPAPVKPVQCACADFCSGMCFAPGCTPCQVKVWDGDEASCLDPGPLGAGLLCDGRTSDPCCSPNGTACSLVGGAWCDCGKYPRQEPLFPPLAGRTYQHGKCLQS